MGLGRVILLISRRSRFCMLSWCAAQSRQCKQLSHSTSSGERCGGGGGGGGGGGAGSGSGTGGGAGSCVSFGLNGASMNETTSGNCAGGAASISPAEPAG